MQNFKQFLRKYKWYRWCEANDVKAHMLLISIIAQSYWVYLIWFPIDTAQLYMLATVLVCSIAKELSDIGDTGFSGVDMAVNLFTWLVWAVLQSVVSVVWVQMGI